MKLQPWFKRELARFGIILLCIIFMNILIVYPIWNIGTIDGRGPYPWRVSYELLLPIFLVFSYSIRTSKHNETL